MKKKLNSIYVNLILSLAFILIFCFKNRYTSITLTLCNGFFSLGIIYLCFALITHVRNLGLFKSLSYIKYRKNKNALKKHNYEQNITTPLPENFHNFYNYILDKYDEKWNCRSFYIISIPSLVISLMFLFIYYV